MPSITDYFAHASNGSGMPVVTYLASTKASGASSMSVNAVSNWPTATCVNLLLYTLSASGVPVSGSTTMWKGILSGTTVGSLTLKGGTDTTYTGGVGSVVEMAPTSSWADDIIFGLLVEHSQAGLHLKVNGNTVPAATDTVALLAATQSFTDKTITDTSNSVSSAILTNPYKFFTYPTGYSGFPNNAFTKVSLNNKITDTSSNFDAVTNFRFTAPVTGFYDFAGAVSMQLLANTHMVGSLYKNGAEWIRGGEGTSSPSTASCGMVVGVKNAALNVGDYVELWSYQAQGSTATVNGGSLPMTTYLSGCLASRT
jgi:hypothetical protein